MLPKHVTDAPAHTKAAFRVKPHIRSTPPLRFETSMFSRIRTRAKCSCGINRTCAINCIRAVNRFDALAQSYAQTRPCGSSCISARCRSVAETSAVHSRSHAHRCKECSIPWQRITSIPNGCLTVDCVAFCVRYRAVSVEKFANVAQTPQGPHEIVASQNCLNCKKSCMTGTAKFVP